MAVSGKKIIGTVACMAGIPAIPEPFFWSWSQMIQYNADYLVEPNERIQYEKTYLSFHAAARNNLVDRMRGEWLIQLDTDHQFDPDLIARLLFCANKYKIDVLTGIYTHKTEPYIPVVYKKEKGLFTPIVLLTKNCEIFQIDSAGSGCLLVRKKVFEKIRKELKENPFDIIHPFGEDHSFFLRLKKIGVKAYCNPNIECNHLSWRTTQWSDLKKDQLTLIERKDIKGYR